MLPVLKTFDLHIGAVSQKKPELEKYLAYKYLLTKKIREIIHRYYRANHYLVELKKDININCSLCDVLPETFNLFWLCNHTKIDGRT